MSDIDSKISKETPDKVFISQIIINELFGTSNLRIPKEQILSGDLSNLLVLYGDNGAGKTTILRILYHLLSPIEGHGHKSQLLKIPFKEFTVKFNTGAVVTAKRDDENLIGKYGIYFGFKNKEKEYFPLIPGPDGRARRGVQEEEYISLLKFLRQIGPSYTFITDDRKIYCTEDAEAMATESERIKRGRRAIGTSTRSIYSEYDDTNELLDITSAIAKFNFWIRKLIIVKSKIGADNIHTTYVELTKQLAKTRKSEPEINHEQLQKIISKLEELNKEISGFAKYKLLASFQADEFIDALKNSSPSNRHIINTVLQPYINGISENIKALAGVKSMLDIFLNHMNGFYNNKLITYSPSDGLVIKSSLNDRIIDPNILSSGEKQLLLLLINCVLHRNGLSVIFVDEPELSLNIKWQRKLLDAICDIADLNTTQFIFATHSLQVLQKFDDYIIKI